MKFNINDKVIYILTGESCIVVATKELPWKKENDILNRKNVFPRKDYLVLREVPKSNFTNFLGEFDVLESDLIFYNHSE